MTTSKVRELGGGRPFIDDIFRVRYITLRCLLLFMDDPMARAGRARLTVGRRGCAVGLSQARIERLSADYRVRHFAALPGLLEDELLAWVMDALDETDFHELAEPPHLARMSGPADGSINKRLSFLFNDSTLFRAVEAITGCPPIGGFAGRVIRLRPGRGHYVNWHCDHPPASRIVTLRVNLNRGPFEGGMLQFRRPDSRTVLSEHDNNICGDAVLFRSTPEIQHRNTEVIGSFPRTTFSGWFHLSSERRGIRWARKPAATT